MYAGVFPVAAGSGALGSTTPIFVVGMHRSGTTLLEQIAGTRKSPMAARLMRSLRR